VSLLHNLAWFILFLNNISKNIPLSLSALRSYSYFWDLFLQNHLHLSLSDWNFCPVIPCLLIWTTHKCLGFLPSYSYYFILNFILYVFPSHIQIIIVSSSLIDAALILILVGFILLSVTSCPVSCNLFTSSAHFPCFCYIE